MDKPKVKTKPITPAQLKRRGRALFGERWVYVLAANLHCTRQHIEGILAGKWKMGASDLMLFEAWESGQMQPEIKNLPDPPRFNGKRSRYA